MRCAVLLVLLLQVAAQEKKPSAGQVAAARKLLQRVARRHTNLATLRARYSQKRESTLALKPLRSGGTLFYSRAQACLVLHGTDPRPVRIRLDRDSYQVYRPRAKRAERFVFKGWHPGRALLQVFTPAIEKLAHSHELIGYSRTAEEVRLVLRPKDKLLRKHLLRLEVTIGNKDGDLRAVAYSNAEHERVLIVLEELARNPKLDPSLFSRTVPKDVTLRVMEVDG